MFRSRRHWSRAAPIENPGDHLLRRRVPACGNLGCDSVHPWWCEELEGDAVGVAERDAGTVGSVLDPVVGDAQLVQAICPPLQFVAATAGEGDMVETGVALVESLSGRLGVGVQSEQMAAR